MKGFIGRIIIIFCMILTISGVFLLINRPTGVGVNCSGEITGLGAPNFPLTSFDSDCSVEVEVSFEGEQVCMGSGQVRNEQSMIACDGLDEYENEDLQVQARFYNDSGNYENTSGTFYNGN